MAGCAAGERHSVSAAAAEGAAEHIASLALQLQETEAYLRTEEEKIWKRNWERYNEVINGFVNTVDILQDRRFTIGTRLYLALEVAREIQNCINSGNYSVLRTNIEPYCNYDNRLNIAKAFATRINHIPNIHDFLNHIFDIIHIGAKKILLLNRIYTPNIKSADEFYEIKEQFNINGSKENINNTIAIILT